MYGCVSIANFVKYFKIRVIDTVGATYDYAHWFFYLPLQLGMTALFSSPYTFSLSCLYLSDCLSICMSVCLPVCLSIHVSVCLCVSVFVCLSVRVSVCMSLCIMYICVLS